MSPVRPPSPLPPERAWDYALLLLGRQAYTSTEMRERLRRRSLPDAEAGRIVGRLEALGLLDDRAYARHYVERRSERLGPNALRFALRRKGVDPRWIDAALAASDEGAQLRAARALLAKEAWRFSARGGGDRGPHRARARGYALLVRRGFEPDVVREAIEAWSDEEDQEAPTPMGGA